MGLLCLWQCFYNNGVDHRDVVGDGVGDHVDVSDAGETFQVGQAAGQP